MICQQVYVSGWKRGQACRFRSSVVIATRSYTEQVCGYHARQFTADVQYPLWANLRQLRRLQMANLDAMESANEAVASFEEGS